MLLASTVRYCCLVCSCVELQVSGTVVKPAFKTYFITMFFHCCCFGDSQHVRASLCLLLLVVPPMLVTSSVLMRFEEVEAVEVEGSSSILTSLSSAVEPCETWNGSIKMVGICSDEKHAVMDRRWIISHSCHFM